MKFPDEQIKPLLQKIQNSSHRTIQANCQFLLDYILANIPEDNPLLNRLNRERIELWQNWPAGQYWEMPTELAKARSLAYDLYRTIAEKGYEIIMSIYFQDADDAIRSLNDDFIDFLYQILQEIYAMAPGADITEVENKTVDPSIVFVVHGRNRPVRDGIFNFLRSLKLSPIEWTQAIQMTGKASPFVGEILETAFTAAQAVVVVLTPDDEVKLKDELLGKDDEEFEKELTGQARPNVLFEGGMAMGRHPDRTVFVQIGKTKPFSDIMGRHLLRLDNSPEKRQDLAMRLKTAGCSVDTSGTDWLNTGSFSL